MRVAIPVRDGKIFEHFGQTERFLLVDVADGQIVGQKEVDATHTGGHAALIPFLAQQGATHAIVTNAGQRALDLLAEAGIATTVGIKGDPIDAVKQLIAGTLVPGENLGCGCSGHHHH